jgi:hypothetical protein
MGAKTEWHVEILATHTETRTISATTRDEAVARACRERGVICVVGVKHGSEVEEDPAVCKKALVD